MYYLTFADKVTAELCPMFTANRLETILSELTKLLNDKALPNWTSVARTLEDGEVYRVDNMLYKYAIKYTGPSRKVNTEAPNLPAVARPKIAANLAPLPLFA